MNRRDFAKIAAAAVTGSTAPTGQAAQQKPPTPSNIEAWALVLTMELESALRAVVAEHQAGRRDDESQFCEDARALLYLVRSVGGSMRGERSKGRRHLAVLRREEERLDALRREVG